ncbi:MAG: CoA-binding protein [Rhodobacteraceae bacterium]|nr:CoA-binding protein [Paracoccaceae bacterium]
MDVTDAVLKDLLTRTRVIAVVGFSPNPARPSHYVARFLQERGYRVIPVNPGHAGEVFLGETVRADLSGIPEPVDMVDIFRQSDAVPGIVAQALAQLPALRTIWMQLGVAHAEAAASAEARGITVIQNRCPKMEYPRLIGDGHRPVSPKG